MGLIEIKFDGACHNKKGESSIMGVGVAVFFDGEYIEEESVAIQVIPENVRGTSNISEWEGCCEAFKMAIQLEQNYPNNEIKIFSDSEIISKQFNDVFGINETSFYFYLGIARKYREQLKNKKLMVEWVKREFNKEADKLSKIGIKGLGQVRKDIYIP